MNCKTIDSNKLQIGFNIIKKIITTEDGFKEHKTLLTIWNMLPTILGSFCCNENSKVIGGNKNSFH